MRIRKQSAKYFSGTHKGREIEIDREPDGRFYITVTAPCGMHDYDGWAPESVTTMAQAKREACYGACLDPRPATHPEAKGGE